MRVSIFGYAITKKSMLNNYFCNSTEISKGSTLELSKQRNI